MPRDYKHSGRSRKKPPPTPGWIYLSGGFAAGLGVALIVHLYHQSDNDQRRPEPARTAVPASQADDDSAESDETFNRDDYDFYEILENMEVVVPQQSIVGRTGEKLTKPAIPQTANLKPGPYLVQTGSFRAAGEAETMRAKLGLLGLRSRIQKAVDASDRTWHRVHVGPIVNKAELERVTVLLGRENIDMLIIRKRD